MRIGRIPCQLIAALIAGAIPALPAIAAARPVESHVAAPAPVTPPPVEVPASPPLPTAPPQAIAAELRAHAGGKLKPVYASRNFLPLWAATGRIGPEADAFIAFLSSAQLDGLNPAAYKVRDLQKAVDQAQNGDAKRIGKAEIALSKALSRYALELRRLPKRDVASVTYADPALKPQKPVEGSVLRIGSLADSFTRYVTAMQWMSPHYLRMRGLLAQAMVLGRPEEDLRRIRLNLERARFLPGARTQHIVVDAASARLWYYQAGRQQGTMRVVVGKQASPTPMLAGSLQYAIANPYWNIPVDLAQTSTAPKVLAGRTLKSMNMEALSDWTEQAHVIDPATIDWNAVAAGTQEVRLRQLPGPYNSMGKIKFLFPNELGIYLHDTPERDLLAKDNRHFSNGCIRLEDAAGLGQWLTGKPLRSFPHEPEQAVALPVSVPVYITYFTATEGADGGVALLDDVYGRDGGTSIVVH